MYSWLLVFAILMVGGDGEGKRRRIETRSVTKERGKATGSSRGKGKMPLVSAPVDRVRRELYSSKKCICERLVNISSLVENVPGFEQLIQTGDLYGICTFPEHTGYGLELIQEFYMCAEPSSDEDGGPYVFTTSVRGVELLITPELIASMLNMTACVDGMDYLYAGFDCSRDWHMIISALCVPNSTNYGMKVLSKDLKFEYCFINLILCYNLLPRANVDVVHWDSLLYMFLLGLPEVVQERHVNINVPLLVWKRMVREIISTNLKDRLPFPLLVMRLLRSRNVDVICTSLDFPLSPICASTIGTTDPQHRPPVSSVPPLVQPTPPAPGAAPGSSSAAAPEEDISLSVLYREQQRLSGQLERVVSGHSALMDVHTSLEKKVDRLSKASRRMSRFLRLLCSKMGCSSSEMPDLDSGSD